MKSSIKMACIRAGALLASLSLWSGACAEATFVDKPLTYRVRNMDGHVVSATVPYVVTEDAVVADRINTLLHLQLLRTLPPSGKLAATRLIDYSFPLESMDGSLGLTNGGRVLTVTVQSEGCGAYCSSGSTDYSFDTRTGRFLAEEELITPEGKAALAALAVKSHAAAVRAKIAQIKKAVRNKTDMLDDESRNVQLQMYENCLAARYTADGSDHAWFFDGPGDIDIGDGAISFSQGACGYHAVQALDDLGEFVLTFQGEAMRPYLTAYGKYLLLGEGDGRMPAINRYAQIFHGKIGANAVTLYMTLAENSSIHWGALYVYDRYGIPIDLSEKKDGDAIEMTETGSKESPPPVLRFRVQGQKLVGQWSGGGKGYAFEAGP